MTHASTSLVATLEALCPDCAAGISARAEVLGPDFAANLAIAVTPFLFIAALCVALERAR